MYYLIVTLLIVGLGLTRRLWLRRGVMGLVGSAQFFEGVTNQTSGTVPSPGLIGVLGVVKAIGQMVIGMGLRHGDGGGY